METALNDSPSPVETSVSEPVVYEEIAQPKPVHWTPWTRLAFRIGFIYMFIFIFMYGNGTIFEIFPVVGGYFDEWMTWPWQQAALWVGHHVFHITGQFSQFHPTGSGDTVLDWVLQLLYVVAAVGGGLLWTAIAAIRGNRRVEYGTMYAWLRFGVRLTVGFFMIGYGLAKVYPRQMPPISIGILNEPVGQMSPMTFLWALIGLNPWYECVCGVAEVIGGVMILFRRTALAGSLISAFVMTNVLLYNMFFDVPVKLFAANLLLGCLFIVLPDVRPLFDFFILHKPSAPVGIWIPPVKRKGFRIATRVVEIVFTVAFLLVVPALDGYGWWQSRKAAMEPSPLLGAWHVDAAHPVTGGFVTPEGLPATDLYIDSVSRAFTRSTDLALWRTRFHVDNKAHTVFIGQMTGPRVTYAWQMPDANHVVLTSVPPKVDPKAKPDASSKTAAKPFVAETMSMTRTPVPSHYPLLDRGFHWVNEWGLER